MKLMILSMAMSALSLSMPGAMAQEPPVGRGAWVYPPAVTTPQIHVQPFVVPTGNPEPLPAPKKKNMFERGFDGVRHQMVAHPKITRAIKWTGSLFLWGCNVMSAFRR